MNYREEVLRTLSFYKNDTQECLILAALGLTGESGEFADLLKKQRYHDKMVSSQDYIKELGDIRWYLEVAAFALGVSMAEVEATNAQKLRARYPDGFNTTDANLRKDEK